MSYRKTFSTPAELKEYTVVSLGMCVVKGALKEYNGTVKKYSLKALRELVEKASWYKGILDDCKNLGLNADKILEDMSFYLNENSILEPIPIIYKDKLHWFEVVQVKGTPTFTTHRTVIIPPEVLTTLKKGGI